MMENSEEAIAWFNGQGYVAWAMETFAPGALFVGTSAKTDQTGATWVQGGLVAVYPEEGMWIVAPLPDMGPGPIFDARSFKSLDEAAAMAKDLIHGNTTDRAEEARRQSQSKWQDILGTLMSEEGDL